VIRRRPAIAVPVHVLEHHPNSGHGRVWHNVLRELRSLARVRIGSERGAHAWLIDGHREPVETGLPVVGQMHETSWGEAATADTLDPRFLELVERRTRETVACLDRIVTASEATRRQIGGYLDFPLDRIDVVPHGVDVDRFRPRAASPFEHPYVLFAATVHPRKNLPALREAMAALAGDFPHRPDSAELEAAAFAPLPNGLMRVERPNDDELAALMAGCDAFVLPSLWEGFGLTALEAMACGAPVIVADRGPLPEVVGDAGVICEPDPAGIEAALRQVLGDPGRARDLGRAARVRAEGMTWRHTAQGWLDSVMLARR
jgi:glycosyltransferase involved in cell wall biosynthesis